MVGWDKAALAAAGPPAAYSGRWSFVSDGTYRTYGSHKSYASHKSHIPRPDGQRRLGNGPGDDPSGNVKHERGVDG